MISWPEIVATVELRRSYDSRLKSKMIDIRDRYNGDYVIPLPNVSTEPIMGQHTPLLIGDAIDNAAMAASSVKPIIHAMAVDSTIRGGKNAAKRRSAWYGLWDHNKMNLKWRRMYRHLAAYGSAAAIIMPDYKNGRAKVEIRDPLSVYPDEMSPEEIRTPTNVAFVFGRSIDWIARYYPQVKQIIDAARLPSKAIEGLWDVVEWVDEEEIVCGILGPRGVNANSSAFVASVPEMELHRWPNRAGCVPAVVPGRITLDQVAGQVNNIVGTVDLMGLLMALDVVAAERGVFPDLYAIARPNERPEILTDDGHWKDGRTGEMNLTKGLAEIGQIQSTPGPATMQTLSYLERSTRLSSGNPALYSGEMNSSIRSGNTVSALQSTAVDPRIQELQEVMEYTLETINYAAAKVEKEYFRGSKIVAFAGTASDQEIVEYQPEAIFDESCDSVVRYPMPGADAARMGVNIAQMVGSALSSRKTGRVLHPYIENPEQEERQIVTERLEDAALTSILQQASTGALPMIDIAEIIAAFRRSDDIVDAIEKAQKKAQERQATMAPAGAPELQPGLSLPGAGVEATQAPNERIGPPTNSVMNLRSLLASIGRTTSA